MIEITIALFILHHFFPGKMRIATNQRSPQLNAKTPINTKKLNTLFLCSCIFLFTSLFHYALWDNFECLVTMCGLECGCVCLCCLISPYKFTRRTTHVLQYIFCWWPIRLFAEYVYIHWFQCDPHYYYVSPVLQYFPHFIFHFTFLSANPSMHSNYYRVRIFSFAQWCCCCCCLLFRRYNFHVEFWLYFSRSV